MRGALFALDPASQPVRNLATNPNLKLSSSGWTSQTPTGNTITSVTSGGGPRGDSGEYRIVITQPTASTGTVRIGLTNGWPASTLLIAEGEQFRVRLAVRAPRTTSGWGIQFEALAFDGTSLGFHKSSTFALAAGWNQVDTTISPPAGARRFGLIQLLSAANIAVLSDEYRAANAQLIRSTAPVDYYADGDTPGWRWTAGSHVSQSVGYPDTLERIAERPMAWFDARYINGRGVANPAEGTGIQTWKNLVGGPDAIQSTASLRPVLRSQSPNLLTYGEAVADRTGTGGWQAGGWTGTTTAVAATQLPDIGGGVQSTGVGPTLGSNQVRAMVSRRITVLPSAGTYYARATIRNDSSVARTILLTVQFFTSANAYISTITAQSQTVQPGATVVFSGSGGTPPSNADRCEVMVMMQNAVVGDAFTTGGAQLSLAPITEWARPISRPGGHPIVQFDSQNDYLEAAGFALPAERSVYAVISQEVFKSSDGVYELRQAGLGPGGVGMYDRVISLSTATFRRDIALDDGTISSGASSAAVIGPQIITARTTSSGAKIRINGGAETGGTSGTSWAFTNAKLFLGVRDSTLGPMPGGIAALLLYPTLHNDATRQAIERWLGRTYGITVA